MTLFCALLCVGFFHFITIPQGYDDVQIGTLMFQQPLIGAMLGIPMLLMAGSCIGKPTPAKRWLGLVGIISLQLLCVPIVLKSGNWLLTSLSCIPFLASSVALQILRVRKNAERERAEKRARDEGERVRQEQVRSTLARKP